MGVRSTNPTQSFFDDFFRSGKDAASGVAVVHPWAKLSSVDVKSPGSPTLSADNLTASTSSSSWHHGRTTLGFTTGKWYWEITPSGNAMVGIEPTSENINRTNFNEGTTAGLASRDGKIWFGGTQVVTGQGDWSDNDVVGVAFNADNGFIYFYINGSLSYSYDSTMSSSAFKKPSYSVYGSWTLTFNFGESGFTHTAPTGYKAITINNGATTS